MGFIKLNLRGYEHEYQIIKLFTTCNEIGWNFEIKLVDYRFMISVN
jgi:hypothetical protein